jgi:hypothetical protein
MFSVVLKEAFIGGRSPMQRQDYSLRSIERSRFTRSVQLPQMDSHHTKVGFGAGRSWTKASARAHKKSFRAGCNSFRSARTKKMHSNPTFGGYISLFCQRTVQVA